MLGAAQRSHAGDWLRQRLMRGVGRSHQTSTAPSERLVTMTENEFAATLVAKLKPLLSDCEIATKKNLFHSLSFDDSGNILLNVDSAKEAIRGGGTGFEQDILLYERAESGTTSIVPRVVAEVKFGNVTTHDAITYSEKARRVRTVYPYVRYGLVLGAMSNIPGRVLRLGEEFDFIVVVDSLNAHKELEDLVTLFQGELQASRDLGKILSGKKKVTGLFKHLSLTFA